MAFQEPHFHGDLGQAQRLRVIKVLADIMDPVDNNVIMSLLLVLTTPDYYVYDFVDRVDSLLTNKTSKNRGT